jgi:hypothetical protein
MRIFGQKMVENGMYCKKKRGNESRHQTTARRRVPVIRCGVILAAALASACTSIDGRISGRAPVPEEQSPAQTVTSDGLERAVFRDLPAETYTYLQSIAAAFQRHDEQFLLGQGEASFEDWAAANLLDSSETLTRLFRIGPYADDTPSAAAQPAPHLTVPDIDGIIYLGWEEWGPLLEVHAQIITHNKAFPARLLVIWRLEHPKIQGYAGD